MTKTVLSFKELTKEKQCTAGGKGGTLSRLFQAGYPVPDGFVILPTSFAGDELTVEAWVQVQAYLKRMRLAEKDITFAVRSSALSEDSAQASYAGEFETVLNVHTDEEIHNAIHTVRRSRHSERVQAYSQVKGLDEEHEVAVVVQRMVQSDLSGILFTADPVTGSHRTMTGNFVHGLGERLVSGEVTGETFTFEKPRGRYQGPAELKRYARKLYKLASGLEKDLGCPQDIEWAVAEDKLFILQSRPITTLQAYNPATGEWNDSLKGDYLWSNVNFGEAIPDVMTPLTWSVVEFVLDDWVFIPDVPMVGNIGGRPYLNISVFASIFRVMGKSREDLLSTLESTLYMNLPDGMEIPSMHLSLRRLLSSLFNSFRIQRNQTKGVRRVGSYLENNADWFKQVRERIKNEEQKAGLLKLWNDEIRPHLKEGVWCVLGSVAYSANYTMKLRRDLIKLVGADDADALIANMSDSTGTLASMGPMIELAKVARGEMSRETYLEEYGHRGPDEFELSQPRPAEDPEWFDRELENYRKSPVDISALLQKQREKFNAAWERLQSRYPRKVKVIRRRIAESARRARLRELVRSAYVRDRWAVRLFALRAGELSGLGNDIFFLTLTEMLDLLAGDERAIRTIAARKEIYHRYKSLPPYPSVIRGRFDPFEWAKDPKRRSDIFDEQANYALEISEFDGINIIKGSPASAGTVEGIVRIIQNPADGHLLQPGEILVAIQTDIAWTTLFPRASGVVTDVGAPLSHAAIVARELGIPAVVGCGNATQRLKTGDRVRVDGGRGIVEILKTN